MNATTRAIVLALIAAPAHADGVYDQPPRMSLLPERDYCFAMVHVVNTHGSYNNVETLDTPRGPVSIRYKTIGGHNATDNDIVEVMDLPEGVWAWPSHVSLPDGDTVDICLMLGSGT